MSGRSDAIDPAAVWQEDRDWIFLERLEKDVELLTLAGVPPDIIKRVIGQYDYVKAWTRCPRWLWPVRKLPKGYRWRDGEKKKVNKRTIILLPIGEDLYIKDPEHMGPTGTRRGESKGICIRNFRKYLAKDIAVEFDGRLGSVILEFYKKQGLPLGYAPPMNEKYIFGAAHPDHKRDPDDKTLDIGFRVLKVVDCKEEFGGMSDTSKISVTLAAEQWDLVVWACQMASGELRMNMLKTSLFVSPHDENLKVFEETVQRMDESMIAVAKAAGVEMEEWPARAGK